MDHVYSVQSIKNLKMTKQNVAQTFVQTIKLLQLMEDASLAIPALSQVTREQIVFRFHGRHVMKDKSD